MEQSDVLDARNIWEREHDKGTYFDCGKDYRDDIIKRRDGALHDECLIGLGIKSGIDIEGHDRKAFFEIENGCQDWNVLEIGCGYGLYAAYLHKYVRRYVGIDISKIITLKGNDALKNAGINNARLFHSECFLNVVEDKTFDFIFSQTVFMHIGTDFVLRYMYDTFKKLKSDGKFIHQFVVKKNDEDIYGSYYSDQIDSICEDFKILGTYDYEYGDPNVFWRYVYGTIPS